MLLKDIVYKIPGAQVCWSKFCYPILLKIRYSCKKIYWYRCLKNINALGITPNGQKRETKIIISFTSYPERMQEVVYVACSMLRQTMKPDEVILNLSIEEFPNREDDLQEELLNLRQFGLSIKWCHNIKSYKKLIPTLERYRNDIIITVDDDVYYPENLVEDLYNGYLANKHAVICRRARHIGCKGQQILPYTEWEILTGGLSPSVRYLQTGVGGVLYPQNSFDEDVLREDIFMKLCPTADDIWFWAMAVLANKKIAVVSMKDLYYINPKEQEGTRTLTHQNVEMGQNDVAFASVIQAYPRIEEILLKESERINEQ